MPPNAAHFPPDVPRIKAEDIADLHWRLHTERGNSEAAIGDTERLYTSPGFR